MADVYKIKATLDADEVGQGAREMQQQLRQAAAAAPSGAAAQEASAGKLSLDILRERTTATERLRRETQRLSTQQRASMILGGSTAAAELGGSLLKAGGYETGAGVLTGAARNAARLGTMLAPLGPQAALIGAAAGGISGAVMSLVESMSTARKKLAAEAEAAKNAADEAEKATRTKRASEIVSRRDFEALSKRDPEAATQFLATIKKDLADAMDFAKQGAPIPQDLDRAALYYPQETRSVIRAGWGRGGLTREQKDLGLALSSGRLSKMAGQAGARDDWKSWNRITDLQNRLYESFPEVMERSFEARAKGERQTGRAAESGLDIASRTLKSGGATGVGAAGVDALQAAGLGVYSNPMKQSEALLASIDNKLGAYLRRQPQGAILT